MVRTSDLGSKGREFNSRSDCYRVKWLLLSWVTVFSSHRISYKSKLFLQWINEINIYS